MPQFHELAISPGLSTEGCLHAAFIILPIWLFCRPTVSVYNVIPHRLGDVFG